MNDIRLKFRTAVRVTVPVTETQTAVNIAGKECDLEEQYQLGTEAALKPHLRTIIILKQGTVWCTSLPGNRVLLSRIPVFPDSNLLLAPVLLSKEGNYKLLPDYGRRYHCL